MASVQGSEDLPEKSVILIEENTGLVKSIYAQYIAAETASAGKDVCYVTPRDAVDIRSQMTHLRILPETGFHIEEMHRMDPDALLDLLTLHSKGDLAIVDQFSFYFIDISLVGFRDAVSRLIAAAKNRQDFSPARRPGNSPAAA